MLFIVQATIEYHHYMSSTEYEKVIHPVEAPDEDTARQKLADYYRNQSREFDVSIYAENITVFETIM